MVSGNKLDILDKSTRFSDLDYDDSISIDVHSPLFKHDRPTLMNKSLWFLHGFEIYRHISAPIHVYSSYALKKAVALIVNPFRESLFAAAAL